jgi:hypothetical protein
MELKTWIRMKNHASPSGPELTLSLYLGHLEVYSVFDSSKAGT